jgi:transglutaminase-like putative cysteine protease
MTGDLTPYGERPPPPGLPELRVRAEDHVKAGRWADLLELDGDLRADAECWGSLWAPLLAVGSRLTDRPDALDRLGEAVASGFRQPWILGGLIEQAFGDDPAWPALQARMAGPVLPPPVQLLEWPTAPAMHPLVLDKVPGDRDAELAAMLPAREPTAWATARALLDWVTHRWPHSNDHVLRADALDVLARVEQGGRFACVEYSIVLSQALNAVGIPARRVTLLAADWHTGLGRGHVVSEAWIDELGRWVLLDGQNGSLWLDEDDRPLGVLELQERFRHDRPARLVGADFGSSTADAADWFRYFAAANATGVAWSGTGPFTPVFQDVDVLGTPRLAGGREDVAPDLSPVTTGVARRKPEHVPTLTFTPVHPYATGVRVSDPSGRLEEVPAGTAWTMPDRPGEHRLTVATTTPYAVLQPWPLVVVRR